MRDNVSEFWEKKLANFKLFKRKYRVANVEYEGFVLGWCCDRPFPVEGVGVGRGVGRRLGWVGSWKGTGVGGRGSWTLKYFRQK